jgi:hypothetical protein
MTLFARLPVLFAAAGLTLASAVAPALAGPNETAFLQSYVGGWKGTGLLTGGETDETFTCRVNVTKGRDNKINYAGRCAVAGLNLSVAGTIAYVDANGRYEAAMTSNATFTGTAVGRRQGGSVVFDLKERETDEKGNDMTISAQVLLQGPNMGLKFHYILNDTGDTMDASVKFERLN